MKNLLKYSGFSLQLNLFLVKILYKVVKWNWKISSGLLVAGLVALSVIALARRRMAAEAKAAEPG